MKAYEIWSIPTGNLLYSAIDPAKVAKIIRGYVDLNNDNSSDDLVVLVVDERGRFLSSESAAKWLATGLENQGDT